MIDDVGHPPTPLVIIDRVRVVVTFQLSAWQFISERGNSTSKSLCHVNSQVPTGMDVTGTAGWALRVQSVGHHRLWWMNFNDGLANLDSDKLNYSYSYI